MVTPAAHAAFLAQAVARRHGLAAHPMRGGEANWCYALGDSLILRIPRDAAAAADLAREAVVIPLAVDAGVPTAPVVEFTGDHMITARLPGGDAVDVPVASGFYEAVGNGLAALHTVTAAPGLGSDAGDDPLDLVRALAADGLIDTATEEWLIAWFGKLRRPELPRVLLHGDVAPQNLMVDAGRFAGFVDWGDARIADPAIDFAKLPLPVVDAALRGYLGASSPADHAASPADLASSAADPGSLAPGLGFSAADPASSAVDLGDWPARVMWHQLHWALGRLADPAPRPGARHWSGTPYARLFGIMRFYTSAGPAWAALLP